jgi:GTP-binding protein EngB required for normal cell division
MIPNQRSDLEAFDFFKNFVDVFIVLTKVDRIKKNQISKKLKAIEDDFVGVKGIIPFSSITKDGLKEIEGILREIFENER